MDRRQYLRHFVIILTGNGAAQVATLLSYPILGRLYSPAAFGVFAMFIAASAIPSSISCGRFDLAVPLAPRWGRMSVLWLCIAISAIVATLSAIGTGIYWSLTSAGASGVLPLLLGATIFLTGTTTAESVFLMREDRYRSASISIVVRTATAALVQIALGFVAATSFSLIAGFVLGLLAQAAMLTLAITTRAERLRPRMKAMRAMFSRFKRQVTIDIPSTLIAAFSLNLIVFLLAVLYDKHTIGYFSVGNRMAMVPLALFNTALAQIFFQKAAHARDTRGHFWHEMKLSIAISGVLSVVVLMLILLFAKPFVVIYMGPTWLPAAEMLMLLAPMLALRSLTMSIATTVFVMRAPHWLLFHNIANVIVTLFAYAIAQMLQLNALHFIAIASAFLSIEYAVFAVFLVSKARSATPQRLYEQFR
jgi:O-antigen/teichoic acid export membrane protein